MLQFFLNFGSALPVLEPELFLQKQSECSRAKATLPGPPLLPPKYEQGANPELELRL